MNAIFIHADRAIKNDGFGFENRAYEPRSRRFVKIKTVGSPIFLPGK
ncbi:MAG: hypothetical protein ACD_40C00022G0002 [uncultured bacterium]|nr:MAG: hypothetical protein ACD_40C00022G0002 [uncultured bacterium]